MSDLDRRKCRECGADIEIVTCAFSGTPASFERLCFDCGWFDMKKYPTYQAALAAKE